MGNIILIGFMGCGKTTIGKKLAERLNFCFCDVDRMIERDNKMSISEIFEHYGEEYFRELETNVIKSLGHTVRNCIISVGGGLPVREQNHIYMQELGEIIYLKISKEVIIKRLENDMTRPMLMEEDKDEKIGTLMKLREPIYLSLADAVIDGSEKDVQDVVEEICQVVKKF